MALIGSLFALAGRFAGRVVNALLGWATVLLFGRVEARRQSILGFVAVGSLAWVATIVGVLVPDVGTILVAAVPRPGFISEDLVRLAMLAAVFVIPLLIGAAGVWLAGGTRTGLVATTRDVLRGYPFTALLAATIAFLAGVALVRRMRSLQRRWEDAHVPVIVQPGRYDAVVAELVDVLERVGLRPQVRPAPRALSLPPRLLDRVAGSALGGMVPDRLALLVRPDMEVLVYPSDVAIAGERATVARARGAIASRLVRAPAWLTMSRESQELEDRMAELRRTLDRGDTLPRGAVAGLDDRLAGLTIPFDEWETLYRVRLQVERDALRGAPREAAESARTPPVTAVEAAAPPAAAVRRASRVEVGAALGILTALVLDIAVQLLPRAGRDRQPRR